MAKPLRDLKSIPRPGMSFEAPYYGWDTDDQAEIARSIRRAVRGVQGDLSLHPEDKDPMP